MSKNVFRFWCVSDDELMQEIVSDAAASELKREHYIDYALKCLRFTTGFYFEFDDSVWPNGAFVFYNEVRQKRCQWLNKRVSNAQILCPKHTAGALVKSMSLHLPRRPDYTRSSKIVAKYPKCYQSVFINGEICGTEIFINDGKIWIKEPIRAGQSCDLTSAYGFLAVSESDYNAAHKSANLLKRGN